MPDFPYEPDAPPTVAEPAALEEFRALASFHVPRDPDTGQPVEDPEQWTIDDLAQLVDTVKEAKSALSELATFVRLEVCRRADKRNVRTLQGDSFAITVPGPKAVERQWDTEALTTVLQAAIMEEIIDPEVLDDVLVPVVSYRVAVEPAKRLLERDDIGEQVRACFTEKPQARYPKVSMP